ncbi:MAG TPA: S-adenosyl-l-methionine hydroxide adenosyltransferase family protein [Pseudogracilibacillus sp.]|nr:S-adenosyl-l-methionine hydroxide adenosyltransferase family protein [Pseudogracilibacillus sp.]
MSNFLVLQTDFGLVDGAVSAMYGVALSVDPTVRVHDLTHDIPQYNIWEGSYRLYQTISYWPEETVFVSVVDPGVGTGRLSVVAKTAHNQYIVTPNNGSLTHIAENFGIVEVREIDETVHRLPNSGESYTFHGRDIYAYTGAKLAAGKISFEEVGPEVPLDQLEIIDHPQAKATESSVTGNIDILDVRFGNLWTNIDRELFVSTNIVHGDLLEVSIADDHGQIYKNVMTYGRSFADSRLGEPLIYVNSVDKLGVALNQGSFAQAYNIGTGANWKIVIRKLKPKEKAS